MILFNKQKAVPLRQMRGVFAKQCKNNFILSSLFLLINIIQYSSQLLLQIIRVGIYYFKITYSCNGSRMLCVTLS